MWLWGSKRSRSIHVANERLYKPQYKDKYINYADHIKMELENFSHWLFTFPLFPPLATIFPSDEKSQDESDWPLWKPCVRNKNKDWIN